MGLSAGDIEKGILKTASPPLGMLLPERRTVRVGGDGALGCCSGTVRGGRASLCPSGDHREAPLQCMG